MNDAQKRERQLRAKIKRLIKAHPDAVIEELLDGSFWPEGLTTEGDYLRLGDDGDSFLQVVFSQDGDAWPDVVSFRDFTKDGGAVRYRTYFGGGESLRTRTAVLILAKAIAMDNEFRPQQRRQREDE